jgi:hypothetical protein
MTPPVRRDDGRVVSGALLSSERRVGPGPQPRARRRPQLSVRAAKPKDRRLQCGGTTAGVVSGARLSSDLLARNYVRVNGELHN